MHNELGGIIVTLTRDFFIYLSQNKLMNNTAQRWGFILGAKSVVAGTHIDEMIKSVKELNASGISATIDNLGEFVLEKKEAIKAKEQIINVIESINQSRVDAHISLKPTQLGLDIDFGFCHENLEEIIAKAHEYGIFINFDMEEHSHLKPSFKLLDTLSKKYNNVGTVIQAYFYESMENIKKYNDLRLRIVKGAYKESDNIAIQQKGQIDKNFIKLIEYNLLHGKFTSIATHDHNIIAKVKKFVKVHNIPENKYEFQMLYGFRKDMQLKLVEEGHNNCTYVPFGKDWYGYFMRRLAERPQNLQLITKQVFNKKMKFIISIGVVLFMIGRLSKRGG